MCMHVYVHVCMFQVQTGTNTKYALLGNNIIVWAHTDFFASADRLCVVFINF